MNFLFTIVTIQTLFIVDTTALKPQSLPTSNQQQILVAAFSFKEFHGIFQAIIEKVMDGQSNNASYTCLNDTDKVIQDLPNKVEYALRFLDADTKIPYGILQGQQVWVGDYNECLNIVSTYNNFTKHVFKGRYFTAKTATLSLGFCIPDSCSKQDAMALLKTLPANFTGLYSSEPKTPDASDIVGIVVCGIICAVVILGTAVDYYTNHSTCPEDEALVNGYNKFENDAANGGSGILSDSVIMMENQSRPRAIVKVFKAFSFFNNTKKLLSTKTANGPLACLNGLRVISMFWVIQGHSYAFSVTTLKGALYAETELVGRFSFQAIMNGTYSVDSFFFLSGLLVAYLALKEWSEKGRFNWIYYFLHRYWRLTPMYAICLMFYTTVYTLLLSGPFQWLNLDPDGPFYTAIYECRTYWWSNLLYINNLYPNYGGQCFGWAWYLANDMQFYILLAPAVILLLHKFKRVGVTLCIVLILASMGSRTITANYYGMNYEGQITKHSKDPWATGGPLYTKPYARWSVYIIGMLTGFVLHQRRCVLRMNKIVALLGWCVATAVGMAVVYGLYYYHHNLDQTMPKGVTLLYLSCARTAWGLAMAWIVLACATGHGWWVNKFLSWKFWAPLGRLTYAAYLVHPMVIFGYYFNGVAPIQFTDLTLIYIFIANLVLSYGIAYVVSMVIETPMMIIEKIALGKA